MKKNVFAKCLVLLLAMLMLLTACSGNSSSSTSGSGSTSGSSSDGSREPVELVWYTAVQSTVSSGMEAAMEAASKYAQEKLNVTLDTHIYSVGDYNSTVSTIVSAGTYMDIVFTGSAYLPFTEFANRNAFTPIEDYLDQYLPQTKANLPQGAWDAFTVNGHIYGVPSLKDLAMNWDFLLNQTMVDDLGVTAPETIDTYADLVPFLHEVKEKRDAKYPDKAGTPIMGSFGSALCGWNHIENLVGNTTTPLVAANIPGLEGIEGYGEGETAFCPFYTDEYREEMRTIRQMVVDGILPIDSQNFDPDMVLLTSGELVGMTSLGYLFIDENSYPNFKVSLIQQETSAMTTSYAQTGCQAISAQSKNVERALEFLELVNTDTYLATTLRFGPEGEGWTDEDNDGIIEDGPLNADPNARSWYWWYGWHFGSVAASKVPAGYPANFGDVIKEFNNASNQESNIGFIFDPEPVTNQVAACNNVVAEYHQQLASGGIDDVDGLIDDFVAKLKENGSDEVVQEVQRQLTEWRASVGKPTKS